MVDNVVLVWEDTDGHKGKAKGHEKAKAKEDKDDEKVGDKEDNSTSDNSTSEEDKKSGGKKHAPTSLSPPSSAPCSSGPPSSSSSTAPPRRNMWAATSARGLAPLVVTHYDKHPPVFLGSQPPGPARLPLMERRLQGLIRWLGVSALHPEGGTVEEVMLEYLDMFCDSEDQLDATIANIIKVLTHWGYDVPD